jgi:ribosomal protein L31
MSCKAQEKHKEFTWGIDDERIHNLHRNDSTKWSTKNWKADTKNSQIKGRPIINGVFPVPRYELVDSTFNGLGNSGDWKGFQLQSKKIIFHSLYLNKNNVNKKFIPDKQNEVFFTIAVLTDSIDTKNYTHTDVSISSRNHPHYVGEGFIRTKSNRIDFISFLSADRNAYAIVNMRLFDLRIGRIILIAPKKDGTLRSLQLESSIMSSDEMDEYIKNLLSNDRSIIDFFMKSDNI